MANTTYQFNNRFGDDEEGTINDFFNLIRHCKQWGIRPAFVNPISINSGYLRVTLRDPIPVEQEAHLNVTKL